MYNNKAPDYLREMQPGNEKVRCKSLIQKIKDDQTTVGIAGEVCMLQVINEYKEILKVKDHKERK